MNHKKPITNRKSKRIKKRVLTIVYSVAIVLFVALSVSWVLSLRKTTVLSPVASGKAIDLSSETMRTVSHLLDTYDLHADSAFLQGSGVVFAKLSTGEEVLLATNKDLDSQIRSLQLTLAHFTIVNKRITRFDYRFDKPVITFAQ